MFIYEARDYIANECDLRKAAVTIKTPENKNHNKFYYFSYGGKHQIRKIKNWLYKDLSHICLKRKKEKVESYLLKFG